MQTFPLHVIGEITFVKVSKNESVRNNPCSEYFAGFFVFLSCSAAFGFDGVDLLVVV